MIRAARRAKTWDPWLWPCFAGGLLTPLANGLLERWLSPTYAAAFGFFLAWTLVGLVFSFRPPTPNWTLRRWMRGAGAGAFVAGLIAYLGWLT